MDLYFLFYWSKEDLKQQSDGQIWSRHYLSINNTTFAKFSVFIVFLIEVENILMCLKNFPSGNLSSNCAWTLHEGFGHVVLCELQHYIKKKVLSKALERYSKIATTAFSFLSITANARAPRSSWQKTKNSCILKCSLVQMTDDENNKRIISH